MKNLIGWGLRSSGKQSSRTGRHICWSCRLSLIEILKQMRAVASRARLAQTAVEKEVREHA